VFSAKYIDQNGFISTSKIFARGVKAFQAENRAESMGGLIMATTFMHLCVARAAAVNLPLSDKSQYYLGSIAPDSVNMDGFAEKKLRWSAHIRDRDFMKWYGNVSAFYRENRGSFQDRDLLLGYAVHILTDLAWDGYYVGKIQPHMQSLEHPAIPDWEACLKDSFRYDSRQIHAHWWEHEVKEQLQRAVPRAINGISPEILGRYQRYITDEYAKTLNIEPAFYIKDNILEELAEEVKQKCAEYL